jgi:hypothetical protein
VEPRFIIFVETVAGEIIRAFTWCKDANSGIERARQDARDLSNFSIRVWADSLEVKS